MWDALKEPNVCHGYEMGMEFTAVRKRRAKGALKALGTAEEATKLSLMPLLKRAAEIPPGSGATSAHRGCPAHWHPNFSGTQGVA